MVVNAVTMIKILAAMIGAGALGTLAASGAADGPTSSVDYNRDIRPILSEYCYACHGPDEGKRKAGLRLDAREHVVESGGGGRPAIIPGDSAGSLLVERIAAAEDDGRMPPAKTGKRLSPAQVELLKRWIDAGARWQEHWAFVPPRRAPLPPVSDITWPRNPIDHFILNKLDVGGLRPSFEADKVTLIRRLTLDLTGLPPTIAEVDAFLADTASDAYERVVDRVLASPHYGERMAQDWLDAARYGDTNGYHYDSDRSMWPYRDYVIKSFNENKPFDQFTIEQIAGDLLPGSTREQNVASGFNRNVTYNEEGGADPEEYLVKYAVDRAATTGTVYLGMTLGCAECHDHKYDPFTQREFYQFYAFFNNVPEDGAEGHDRPHPPVMKLPAPEQEARLIQVRAQLAMLEKDLKERPARAAEAQGKWETQLRTSPPRTRLSEGLVAHYELDAKDDVRVFDSSGHYRHGTYTGGKAAWAPGRVGGALKFDGKGGSAELGDLADFERTDAFSCACWVWVDGPGGVVVSRMDEGQAHRGWDLGIVGGRIWAHFVNAYPDRALKVTTKADVPARSWHHVMVAYDGSGRAAGVRVYLDGKSQDLEVERDTLTDTLRARVPLRIGRRNAGMPFHGLIDDVRVYDRYLTAAEADELSTLAPVRAVLAIAPDQRTPEEKGFVQNHYLDRVDPEYGKLRDRVAATRKEEAQIDAAIPITLVMAEQEKRRAAHVLIRGDFQQKGEVVEADVPGVFPRLPADKPRNRIGLAWWLIDEKNPLTARVTVNRLWAHFFGAGLVRTANDFGSQGEPPSHPELLDWLATEFAGQGWDVRRMVRLMVTSAAYRQDSRVKGNHSDLDPYNRLLCRAPRLRLPAEQVRDNALAIAGLLNRRIGGPSVFPPQPANYYGDKGRWQWTPSVGADLYRRGLYTFWRRTTFYPSFQIFDAPSREACTVDRPRTNTPLQALVTLNDPVFVEAARVFAQRIMLEGGDGLDRRVVFAFRTAVAREPRPAEAGVLARMVEAQLDRFRKDMAAAKALAGSGPAPHAEGLDVAELAAWTACANALLNLDETITRE